MSKQVTDLIEQKHWTVKQITSLIQLSTIIDLQL